MTYFPINNFDLIKFRKSNTKNKKYDAIIQNKQNKKQFIIPFGDSRYMHYKDTTPLKLYTHLNHNDIKRRELYKKRHSTFIKNGYYSAGYFSQKYLW